MEGRCPEGCTIDTGKTRLDEMNWRYGRRMAARSEGGQGPEGAVETYVGGWTELHSCVRKGR